MANEIKKYLKEGYPHLSDKEIDVLEFLDAMLSAGDFLPTLCKRLFRYKYQANESAYLCRHCFRLA